MIYTFNVQTIGQAIVVVVADNEQLARELVANNDFADVQDVEILDFDGESAELIDEEEEDESN